MPIQLKVILQQAYLWARFKRQKNFWPHSYKVSKIVGDCFDSPGDSWLIILLALVDDEEEQRKKSDDDIEH